jgi:hypothetical protein
VATNILILGAGASSHYDFPLAYDIVKYYRDGTASILPHLDALRLDRTRFDRFIPRLLSSGCTSIDQFADYLNDPDDIFMAKALLAYHIAFREQRTVLPQKWKGGPWYELLANHLIGRALDDFPLRDIAIVTFNYDRSLEQYLLDCLTSRFRGPRTQEQIEDAFRRLDIVHIYGHLGHLPGFAPKKGDPEREYQQIVNREQLELAISGMHLLPELRDNVGLGDRQAARECIHAASASISFLGFAYAQENLEALALLSNRTRKTLNGTILGISEGEPYAELDARLNALCGAAFNSAWRCDVFDAFRLHPTTILGKPRIPASSG